MSHVSMQAMWVGVILGSYVVDFRLLGQSVTGPDKTVWLPVLSLTTELKDKADSLRLFGVPLPVFLQQADACSKASSV